MAYIQYVCANVYLRIKSADRLLSMVNEALMCKKSDWLPFKCTRSPTLSDEMAVSGTRRERETYAIWFNEVSPSSSSYGEEVIYSL